MECEMEIEDDSLDASGTEEATPPMEPTISVAPPIPVVADLCVDDKGQKVNQALPPTPQEEGSSKVEEDEPLPPGVEEEAEPLPPGIDIDSATSSKDMGKASSVSQEPGRGGQSLAASMAQTAGECDFLPTTSTSWWPAFYLKVSEQALCGIPVRVLLCTLAIIGGSTLLCECSRDKFYQAPSFFSCNIKKLRGAWV